MTEKQGAPLIIVAHAGERKAMERAFGRLDVRIAVVGEALHGFQASSILVTPGVSTSSEWFRQIAVLRMLPGAQVYLISSDWVARFYG